MVSNKNIKKVSEPEVVVKEEAAVYDDDPVDFAQKNKSDLRDKVVVSDLDHHDHIAMAVISALILSNNYPIDTEEEIEALIDKTADISHALIVRRRDYTPL